MANLGQEFDVNSLPVSESNFDPLPAGWYDVNITGADLKDTKDGTGNYINVKYSVTGPSHQGRVVFGMLNLKNKNPKAEEIGRMDLGNLMRAAGIARVTDSDQLVGARLQIKLVIDEAQNGYQPRNSVKGYKSLGSSPAPVVTAQPSASASSSAPPWAKKG